MADQIDSPDDAPDAPSSGPTRRSRAAATTGNGRMRRRARRTEWTIVGPTSAVPTPSSAVAVSAAPPTAPVARRRRRPVRSLLTILAVTGLVATVAIPAYAAWQPEESATTMQQLAENGAQTLVVASDVEASALTRDSYSATTPEEIAKAKAAEEAAARAKAEAAARAAGPAGGRQPVDLSSIPVGTGKLSWPLHSMTGMSDMFGARGGSHTGVDMLAPAMTPIFASADGVVSESVEGGGGFGVYVKVEHVIDGVRVSTIYAHMSYGTRAVSPGQTVARGQQIGSVGSTGYSTTNHVHYVVEVNGVRVDPMPWLGPFGS